MKYGTFQKKKNYLIMKIWYCVNLLCHFKMILSNHNEITRNLNLHFWGKIFTSISCDVCTENSYSKMFSARTFLFVDRFSKSLLHILRQTNCSFVQNISSRFKQLQCICEQYYQFLCLSSHVLFLCCSNRWESSTSCSTWMLPLV